MEKLTVENFNERIKDRKLIDLLISKPHPNKYFNRNGHTYYDFVLWKTNWHKRPLKNIIADINKMINKLDVSGNG